MKNGLLVLMLGFSILVNAQVDNLPTLEIIGRAKFQVIPDWITIDYNLNVKGKEQKDVIEKLNVQTKILTDRLVELGYPKSKLKLSDISIDINYDYSSDKWKKDGYSGFQKLVMQIPFDKESISVIIDKLFDDKLKDLSLSFDVSLSDSLRQTTRDELIRIAMENAQKSADFITKNSQIKLKRIVKIDYQDLFFKSRFAQILPPPPPPPMEMEQEAQADYKLAITRQLDIKEQEVYDEIKIIWEIENVR